MHRPRASTARALVAGLALTLGAHVLAAQSAAAQEQPHDPEVRRLVLRGVKHVDVRELQKSIATQGSQCKNLLLAPFCLVSHSPTFVDRYYLDHDELPRDVMRIRVFYWLRGYRDAQVDTAVTPNGPGVTVTFDIHENAPTRVAELRIVYDSTLISHRARNALTLLLAGDPLNLITLDSMRVLWQGAMWNKGHSDAKVDTSITVDTARKVADVTMQVIPNWTTRVASIVVSGNQKVDRQTILNSLTFREGDLFRRLDVLQSQRNLYESNLFRLVSIPPPAGDSLKKVTVQVLEAPLHDASVGGGFNTVDYGQIQADFTDYNVFGGARRLDLAASVGNFFAPAFKGTEVFGNTVDNLSAADQRLFLQPTWAASADFKQPAFLHRPADAVSVGVFAHRREAPGIYVDRGYGATATYTHTLDPRAPISVNYRYELTRVEAGDLYFCVDYGVCDTTTIRSLRSHESLSPLLITGFVDRTDQAFESHQGYLVHMDFEHASSVTQSAYRYNRAFLDAAYFFPFGRARNVVLATHAQLGIVRALSGTVTGLEVLHPSKRFYAGGARSVRGYGENQLGPRILTVEEGTLRGDSIVGSDTIFTHCPASVPVTSCNPNVAGLTNGDFQPRPLGGTSLLLGSAELRFPLWPTYNLIGAVFVDGAAVGESPLQSISDLRRIAKGTGAITPGLGVRYQSPVGPIRIDAGYAPTITENLTVVTATTVDGVRRIVALSTPRRYTQGTGTLLNRMVLHFSIGEAF